jgi:MFS family permease
LIFQNLPVISGKFSPFTENLLLPVNEILYRTIITIRYAFDHSFWESTILIEWGLVCEQSYKGTMAKMLLFTGFGTGTFVSGLISDKYGRKSAIVLMAQLLFGCGILTSTMPTYVSFVFFWYLTGLILLLNPL